MANTSPERPDRVDNILAEGSEKVRSLLGTLEDDQPVKLHAGTFFIDNSILTESERELWESLRALEPPTKQHSFGMWIARVDSRSGCRQIEPDEQVGVRARLTVDLEPGGWKGRFGRAVLRVTELNKLT
jgi:hypothetical protein